MAVKRLRMNMSALPGARCQSLTIIAMVGLLLSLNCWSRVLKLLMDWFGWCVKGWICNWTDHRTIDFIVYLKRSLPGSRSLQSFQSLDPWDLLTQRNFAGLQSLLNRWRAEEEVDGMNMRAPDTWITWTVGGGENLLKGHRKKLLKAERDSGQLYRWDTTLLYEEKEKVREGWRSADSGSSQLARLVVQPHPTPALIVHHEVSGSAGTADCSRTSAFSRLGGECQDVIWTRNEVDDRYSPAGGWYSSHPAFRETTTSGLGKQSDGRVHRGPVDGKQ
jgi:hypothetical protein